MRFPFWELGVAMNHWPVPLRLGQHPHVRPTWRAVVRLVRREPEIFLSLAALAGMLLAPRPASAEEAPSYTVTVEHRHEARTVVHAIDDAPRIADYANQTLTRSDAPQRWPGWVTLGVGVLAIGMGGGSAYSAVQDGLTLRQQVTANPLQYASPAAQQQVADKAASLNNQLMIGASVAVAGVAVAGVGTWLLLRQPSRYAAVVPTPQGVLLAMRF